MTAISRFRHIDADTDQEYRGEAELTFPSKDSDSCAWMAPTDADILSVYRVNADGTFTEVYRDNTPRAMWQEFEVAAIDCYNHPPAEWPIELPTDTAPGGEQAPGEYQVWMKIGDRERKVWIEPAGGSARVFDASTGDELTEQVPGPAREKMWQDAYDEAAAELHLD